MENKTTAKPYLSEQHASAWAAMRSVAAKVGCAAETLW
jgi:hypothetical protein